MFSKKNNAKTTINQTGGLNTTDLTVTVNDISKLSDTPDFLCTLWDKENYPDPSDDSNMEIIKITDINGSTLTIERGQEDSTAKTHASGSAIEMLITAGIFTEIEDAITGSGHTQNTDTKLDEGGTNEISVSEIPKALDTYVEYYIETTGSDVTGDGSVGNPFASITHALSIAPHFAKADDAFIQIQLGTGTFTENIIIGGFQCAIYIFGSGRNNTTINGSFRIKDSTYVAVSSLQVNISSIYAFYVERSKMIGASLKLSGGSNASGFSATAGSIIAYSNINDGIVPIHKRISSDTGSFILRDSSSFASDNDGAVSGFVSESVNIINSDYEDAIFKKHAHNTDTILDETGGNEVSAEEIRNHIDSGLTSMFVEDYEGFLKPIDDYFGPSGAFELDANNDLIPKATVVSDLFFEYDVNNDLIPKE